MTILEQHDQIYTQPHWTVPNDPHMIQRLDAEWDAIKRDNPEFKPEALHHMIARIYDVSMSDSEIRQALFHRITEHYNVDYEILYNTWLAGGCDVRTQELQTQ